ncbi:MAG: prohibitin family protein [Candidatus Eisenbacteria bacterium]|uniref:Prohibitin family protein n=1 Tax=Eiseniibacteriota bacterium TaxID=2212470 RepID=A0A849SIS5_UNCEI|nr:prohibitin family protein [Candidatus Eisenbacteria bacterium]
MKRSDWLLLLALAGTVGGCAAVPAEHVGVIEVYGAVQKGTWAPGAHVWMPWQGVHRISCRTQSIEERTTSPTSEGLVVGLDVSIVFHIDPSRAREVYSRYGGLQAMIDNVIVPEFRSTTRDVTAGFQASDLYSGRRAEVSLRMNEEIKGRLSDRGVVVEAVLLRNLNLPEQVANAVQAKLAADQQAQQMDFVLRKEEKEADRKRIEARGIADYQKIVSTGLNELLLRWKGIEATAKLAESANAKTVVIGAGKDGLPLILGQ